ncbi:MAG: CRISPR-associated endonuclease Cas6, partial [Planctomycetaceae bacterium]|nr:CRISPR-associated endonuclease Cas6 [Planctomycetaceae bacterium]
GKKIPVFERNIEISNVEFGYADETFMYEFTSPWIGLNQQNFKRFETADEKEKYGILKSALIGNILSTGSIHKFWKQIFKLSDMFFPCLSQQIF